MAWYTIEDIARRAGYCVLPQGGAWVCIMGCPVWPRGQRLIQAHREIGIQHLDIYWGCKEVFALRLPTVKRWHLSRMSLPSSVAYDISQGYEPEEALANAAAELKSWVIGDPRKPGRWVSLRSPHASLQQLTLITISYPYPAEEVRFYNSEVRVFDTEAIRILLEEDQVEVIPFGQSQRVMLEDTVRELVDAYQIDGLSWAQAYQEIVGLGMVEPGGFVPQRFYRPRGWFRQQFCEEV